MHKSYTYPGYLNGYLLILKGCNKYPYFIFQPNPQSQTIDWHHISSSFPPNPPAKISRESQPTRWFVSTKWDQTQIELSLDLHVNHQTFNS